MPGLNKVDLYFATDFVFQKIGFNGLECVDICLPKKVKNKKESLDSWIIKLKNTTKNTYL